MIVRQVVNTVFKSCSYIIVNDGCSWLVDCGDVDRLLPLIEGRLCGILLTHSHFDHIYGLNHMLALLPGLQVFTNQAGKDGLLNDKLNFSRYYEDPFVLDSSANISIIEDGGRFELFKGIDAQARFTPGHSPCSVTWMIGDDMIFTGDSYIPGVKTVTNLPQSDKVMAKQSEKLIFRLAENRVVYPGHAPQDSLTL